MALSMLDANICIRVLRDRPPEARERFRDEAQSLSISTIVMFELLYGAERSQRPEAQRTLVQAFSSHIAVLPFDGAAARHAADIRADLARKGQLIGPYDMLIAGHARSLGLTVVTNNLREFTRVEGLRCEDWL